MSSSKIIFFAFVNYRTDQIRSENIYIMRLCKYNFHAINLCFNEIDGSICICSRTVVNTVNTIVTDPRVYLKLTQAII